MSFLGKLLGKKPTTRIRICPECGMPVAEHKDWCSILKGQRAMQQRAAEAVGAE